jgi:hypothetical protein
MTKFARQRLRFPTVLIATAFAMLTVGAEEPAATPSPRVVRFLGQRAADVIMRADRARAFLLAAERAKEGEPAVGFYRVKSAGKEQGETSARKLAELLGNEKTYRFDTKRLGGFSPLVGIRLRDADRSIEVVLSFATDELVVFSRNPEDGSLRSAQSDVAPARAALVRWVKQALPEDRQVQLLDEKSGGEAVREKADSTDR